MKKFLQKILPKRKGHAYPLSVDNLKYWPKDTVYDGPKDKISLQDFNNKYNKHIRLDDVYGKGYEENISSEEYLECKVIIPNKYGIEKYIPNYEYTSVAKEFAESLVHNNFRKFNENLTPYSKLTLIDKIQVVGASDISFFLSNWLQEIKSNANSQLKISVIWNYNQCRPIVKIGFEKFYPIYVLFHLFDRKITNIVITDKYFPGIKSKLSDIEEPSFCVRTVLPYLRERIESQSNHFACPVCGTDSKNLDWIRLEIPDGKFGREGLLSICPRCAKVTEINLLKNIPVKNIEAEQFNPIPRPQKECFNPRLMGVMTFETHDEEMDFHSDEDLERILQTNIQSYRQSGDLDKGNDAAIILSNKGKEEESLTLFTEIAEKGNTLAMSNVFTVLWAVKLDYKKATEWLTYVEGYDQPSLICLWNLAVMYYSGSSLSHNILKKDLKKSKILLNRIISLDNPMLEKEDKKIVERAKQFLNVVDFINLYSLNGQEVHEIITKSIVKTDWLRDKGELFFRARSISPKTGLKLGAKIASSNTDDIGDESRFYFYNDSGETFNFKPELLQVERSEMGAWQVYLMLTAPTVMPVFWHGGYICRRFIFDVSDLEKIKAIEKYDFTILAMDDILLPTVNMTEDKKSADVFCTYWNEWKGLVREHIRVFFNEDGSASVSEPEEFIYYSYDCGILF